MKRLTTVLFVALATVAFAGLAFAQGWVTATPLYGTHAVTAGFTPDPMSVSVTAGGSEPASAIGAPSNCLGSIVSAQPDVRVNYTAGSFPLRFYVVSGADTTLIVNAADGTWHCNDDFSGYNPAVDIPSPPSGQYDIWVGTYSGGTGAAMFYITELPSVNGP